MNIFLTDELLSLSNFINNRLVYFKHIDVDGKVRNIKKAMELLSERPTDLLIVATNFVDAEFQICVRKIRQNQMAKIIIIFSYQNSPKHREMCLRAGADFYFDDIDDFQKITELIQFLNSIFSQRPVPMLNSEYLTSRRKNNRFKRINQKLN